ncbi:DUF2330 domain-containing protein [bacterium]|nr:DUF2330 domain-containing protein [bacterium]
MMRTALILAVTLAVAAAARADGGLFAPWQYRIYENEQTALLDWDADRGVETLTIQPGFTGDVQEFAWVVPLPAEPQLRAAEVELFADLFRATRPVYRQRDEAWSCESTGYDALAPGQNDGVDVLQDVAVGIYDVMVLASDQASSLVDTLDVWGYLHEDNRELATPILEDYVARDWVFVTVRVDSASFAEWVQDVPWFGYGTVQPLEMAFAAEAPIYPMRISAISATADSRVTVFAVADERLIFEGAETRYANRFGEQELAAFAEHWPHAAERLQPGRFLTRLERTMGPEDMDADLVLEPSDDRREFRPVVYSGVVDVGVFLVPVLAVLTIGRWRARRCQPR